MRNDNAVTQDFGATAPRGSVDLPVTKVRYFGDYEIIEELGRGGMGVVYHARQVTLNRPVALKMIRAGVLTGDDALRRFQNEAEAVASLDHPGIVPIYEVGENQGQWFFSMKLVPGGSLVPQLQRFSEDPRAAALLVVEVAEAVAHAHARGILHRDLKPANLLIDAEGHPHVTDFGLAKRIESDVELTVSGAIMGTPAYMAPEQAEGRGGAITTATDVYGLGAVLYALLTGRAPFGGDSVVQTLDAVRSSPPEPLRRLNTRVPRDLETICLKCLDKDPRRRYPTAQSLADDLSAWLDSRPIAARRVGIAERALLWCQRRPVIAGLAAAVLLAILGGVTAVIAVQARANWELIEANARITEANESLASANSQVQARYDLAVEAIGTFHTGVSEDFLLQEDQFKELRDRLLNSASVFYQRLGNLLERGDGPAARRALLQANFELAALTDQVGRPEDALAMQQLVLIGREALAAEDPSDWLKAAELALSHVAVGRLLEAKGQTNEALAAYERAAAAVAKDKGGPPDDTDARIAFAEAVYQYGVLLGQVGRIDDALAALTRARDLQVDLADASSDDELRFKLSRSHYSIAGLLAMTGNTEKALASDHATLAILQELVEAHPDNSLYKANLAKSHNGIGVSLRQLDRPAEALESYQAALALQRSLVETNPAVKRHRVSLAHSHHNIGNVLNQLGKPTEALTSYQAALALNEDLVEDSPDVPRYRADLASSHRVIGILKKQAGQPADALLSYEAAREIERKLAEAYPDVTEYRVELAWTCFNIGILLMETGDPAKALPACLEARALQQQLTEADLNVVSYRVDLADSYHLIADLMVQMGDFAKAVTAYDAAEAIRQELLEADPNSIKLRLALVDCKQRGSLALRRLGRDTEAREACDRVIAISQALVAEAPEAPLFRELLAEGHQARGLARHALGDLSGASDDARLAVAYWGDLSSASGEHRFKAACAHAALAGLAGAPGSGVPAEDALGEAETAIKLLRQAMQMGALSHDRCSSEAALNPLKDHSDFQLLMRDLTVAQTSN